MLALLTDCRLEPSKLCSPGSTPGGALAKLKEAARLTVEVKFARLCGVGTGDDDLTYSTVGHRVTPYVGSGNHTA